MRAPFGKQEPLKHQSLRGLRLAPLVRQVQMYGALTLSI
jgi:hypothetical protein